MTAWKFVHAADIHLDSPMLGLEQHEGAPAERLRGATRKALENLVTLCIQEEAEFLLIAGDLYDGDWRDYNTGLFFVRQMAQLRESGNRPSSLEACALLTLNRRSMSATPKGLLRVWPMRGRARAASRRGAPGRCVSPAYCPGLPPPPA